MDTFSMENECFSFSLTSFCSVSSDPIVTTCAFLSCDPSVQNKQKEVLKMRVFYGDELYLYSSWLTSCVTLDLSCYPFGVVWKLLPPTHWNLVTYHLAGGVLGGGISAYMGCAYLRLFHGS